MTPMTMADQKTNDIMKIYQAPETEITRLHLAQGVMQGDEIIDLDDAVSVKGGEIQTNASALFDEEEGTTPRPTSLWDD